MKKLEKKSAVNIIVLILSIAMLAAGVSFVAASMSPRAEWVDLMNRYGSVSHPLGDDYELNMSYNGYAVTLSGTLTYDEGGSVDPVFGVPSDSVFIVRISEMYQYKKNSDGSFDTVWSEEILPGDDGHANPESYPENSRSGFYSAHNVKIGALKVTDEQLAMLTKRRPIEALPDVDVRGFHTEGNYITNSSSLSSPKIGDVRIRFEEADTDIMTVVGMQRSGEVVPWRPDDVTKLRIMHVFDGTMTAGDAADAMMHVEEAGHVVWWQTAVGAVLTVLGALAFVFGYATATGYEPMLKKPALTGRSAAIAHGVLLAVLTVLTAAAGAWARVSALILILPLVLLALYLYFAAIDMFKRTPRRPKVEEEYKPILIKKDRFDKK